MTKVSSTEPDWSREELKAGEWNPGKRLLQSIRLYQRMRHAPGFLAKVRWRWAVLSHRIWSMVSGAEIPLNCQIDGGLLMPHPNGIVIHAKARIGPNCLIFQQVTVGTRGSAEAPIISGHVDIGAGAKILGPVEIGEHALIGANAVVIESVPAFGVAVGVPAVVREIRHGA